jgi:hypothetical protein
MKRCLLSTVSVDRRHHSAGTIGNLLPCDIPRRSRQAAHTATHQRIPMFTLQVCKVQLRTRNAIFTISACLVLKSLPDLYPIKHPMYCAVVSADARTYRKFLKQDTQGGYCLLSSNKLRANRRTSPVYPHTCWTTIRKAEPCDKPMSVSTTLTKRHCSRHNQE